MTDTTRKKVLLISNRVMHYRVSLYNYFSRRFRENGWELLVRGDEMQKENPYPPHFDYRSIPFSFAEYRREIKKIKPDAVIIFLHLRDAVIWPLLLWLKFKGVPVVFWTKGANLDAPGDRVSLALYRFMHWAMDGLIFYSEKELHFVRRKHRHKVTVASNTINFDDFPEITQSKEEIKRSLSIPFDKVVLSVGRMGADNQRKKVHHLVEIFRDIDLEGVGLVLVGSGLQDEVKRRINPRNTLYLGQVHDPANRQISSIFTMADLFCIPGHIGLGVNQAFYFRLPVVTEEGSQPPEINYLVNGRNGFIVPEDDLDALREKIVYLLENEEVRREFGRNARNDILENASPERMFTGFLEALNRVSDTKDPAA